MLYGQLFLLKNLPPCLRNKHATSWDAGAEIGPGRFVFLHYNLWVLCFIVAIHKAGTMHCLKHTFFKNAVQMKAKICVHLFTHTDNVYVCVYISICRQSWLAKISTQKHTCNISAEANGVRIQPLGHYFKLQNSFHAENKNKQTNKTPSHHGTFKKYFPRAKWLFPLPHKLAAKSGTVLKTSHACRIRYKICRKAGTYFLTTVCSSHISQLLSSLM